MNYNAKLCTGRKVIVRELTTADEELALKSVGNTDIQTPVGMKIFMQEMMRMMIISIDDKPVTYQHLSETPWQNLFNIKETRQLEKFYQELHMPTPKEDSDFLLTIKPV